MLTFSLTPTKHVTLFYGVSTIKSDFFVVVVQAYLTIGRSLSK